MSVYLAWTTFNMFIRFDLTFNENGVSHIIFLLWHALAIKNMNNDWSTSNKSFKEAFLCIDDFEELVSFKKLNVGVIKVRDVFLCQYGFKKGWTLLEIQVISSESPFSRAVII